MAVITAPCICLFLWLAVIVTFLIAGPIMYTTPCPQCVTNSTNCILNSYQINPTQCNNYNDDDIIYHCNELVLVCTYNSTNSPQNVDVCIAPYQNFYSYKNAVNYYNNHFYVNQTLHIYFEQNDTCSYYGPQIVPYEQLAGLIFIIFGAIFAVISICVLFCLIRAKTNTPPKYSSQSANSDIPPSYVGSDGLPSYQRID